MAGEVIFEGEHSLGTIGTQCTNERTMIGVTLAEIRHNLGFGDEEPFQAGGGESPGSLRVDSASIGEAYVTKYHDDGRTTVEVMDNCAVVRVHEYDGDGALLKTSDVPDTEEGYVVLAQLRADLFTLNT